MEKSFKINQLVWDGEAKEYVLITNGVPIVEGKPEINPTEAIALRVCGLPSDDKPRLAFTYRQVKAACLEVLENEAAAKLFHMFLGSGEINKHFNFLGRI